MMDSKSMRLFCLMLNKRNDTANGTAQTRNPNIIAFLIECMIIFPFFSFSMMLWDERLNFKGFRSSVRSQAAGRDLTISQQAAVYVLFCRTTTCRNIEKITQTIIAATFQPRNATLERVAY